MAKRRRKSKLKRKLRLKRRAKLKRKAKLKPKLKRLKKVIEKPKPVEVDKIKRVKIRVVGIGGGGGNIVSEIAQNVSRASFFAANSDLKALKTLSRKVEKFPFGQNITRGLGTGMNPETGKLAAKNERENIKKIFEGQDFVILIASLGGGIGSGASPVFARISKNLGNLTYGIFTLPFKFEGEKKMEIAKSALKELKGNLNALTILPNESIFQIINRATPLKKALSEINKNLADSLQSLIEIIYTAGLINIDFADFKTIFEGRGRLTYLNSVEIGKEETKEAIEKIINSPLYPYSIEGAKGVLLNISGQKELSLAQVGQISKTISEKVNREAKIIFGISRAQKDSKIRVSLLATGCSKKIFAEKSKKRLKLGSRRRLRRKKTESPQGLSAVAKKFRIKISPGISSPPEIKEKNEIRKNALQVKREAEKEEAEIVAKEKFWESPSFLRKKQS